MQSTHTIGAVKIRTFEAFDESCSASRSASCSAMLDYGQQFKFKAYAQQTTWTSFYKEHRWQLARNRNSWSGCIKQANLGKLRYHLSSTMSTKKGNNSKKGQRHQNTKAYKNDLHDTSKKTKQINSLVVGGVCTRCREIIEWRKKFNKYKPLTAPKKWYISFPVQLWIVAIRILKRYENHQMIFPTLPFPLPYPDTHLGKSTWPGFFER